MTRAKNRPPTDSETDATQIGHKTACFNHSMPQITVRHHLSATLVLAAAHMARVSEWYEHEFSKGRPVELNAASHHSGQVMGSIFLSVAFMESYINEVFSDSADGVPSLAHSSLASHEIAILGRMWCRGIPRRARFGVLEKYQIALDTLGRPPFKEGQNPFQDAQLAVDLRNALVHWEPESLPITSTMETPTEELHRIEKKYKGKFSPWRMKEDCTPFWPFKCLCADCAKWTVRSSVAFVRRFVEVLGVSAYTDILFDNLDLGE
jgi:hypothetical protein